MSSALSAPWFGQILRWTRSAAVDCRHWGGWETWYGQRRYEIINFDRRTAAQVGCAPGWHFTTHPDAPLDDPFLPWPGPCVGTTLAAARVSAEVHILASESDRQPTNYSPNLALAVAGGGAVCQIEGTLLAVWPDPQRGWLRIQGDGDKKVIATVMPLFNDVSTAGLRWLPALADGTTLAMEQTWHGAVRAAGAVGIEALNGTGQVVVR